MAADHIQFLKEKFISDFQEAAAELVELPLRLHFQKIVDVLQDKTINPSTPIVMKDSLYQLKYELAECVFLAEKEQEHKTQNKRSHFNAHSVMTIWSLCKIGKRLLRVEAKLREMSDNAAAESSSSSDLVTIYSTPPSIRPKIYGFDDQLQKIAALLRETPDGNSIKAIGIVGMGGIGKTALAKMVFDKSQFDLKFWVQLSEKLNPENLESRAEIISKILEHFDGSATTHASQNDLLRDLYHNLLNKKYLIVLDNVCHLSDWYANLGSNVGSDWSLLSHGLPEGSGGAIIVTSRLEHVASHMVGERNLVQLHRTLDASLCWKIFMDSLHMKDIVTRDHIPTVERMKCEIVD
uniref:NB-ARC domain-containing protein n=1 Tax=Davidia involucrata TaxID=16924 RepID=A0A5B7BH59_DAVIN